MRSYSKALKLEVCALLLTVGLSAGCISVKKESKAPTLQKNLSKAELENAKAMKQNVNAFANLRPQHFTDAMLVRSTDANSYVYTQSPIFQDELDATVAKKSPVRSVTRGYYLLDEFAK